MDVTTVKFKFKYNPVYVTLLSLALTLLTLGVLFELWALLHGFSWHRAISAFLFALLLSSIFNDVPKSLTASHDGISIKKFIGCATFPISDIIDIRLPDAQSFKITFIGVGYRTSEKKNHLLSTYVTQKDNIIILESKFGNSKLRFAISCPDEYTQKQLLNYMGQIRNNMKSKEVIENKD